MESGDELGVDVRAGGGWRWWHGGERSGTGDFDRARV